MPNLPMPEGLGTPDLECVMVSLAPIMIFGPQGVMPDEYKKDLFFGTTPELKYAQGAVSEDKAHATLLFGIHPSPSYRKNVNSVLKTWDMPEEIFISQASTFPIRDEDQEYYVVKGDVKVTPALLEGRARLEVLDYTDKFPVWHPHVTLAYVKRTADIDTWVTYLDEQIGGHRFELTGLDYGDEKG